MRSSTRSFIPSRGAWSQSATAYCVSAALRSGRTRWSRWRASTAEPCGSRSRKFRPLVRLLARLRPRTTIGAHQQEAREPWQVARKEDDHLGVERDDDFLAAAQDAAHHDARGLIGLHAQPGRHWIRDVRVQPAPIVDATDVRIDEPWRDQRDADARVFQVAVQCL